MSGRPGRRQPEEQRAERRVLAGRRDVARERLEVVEELLVLVERRARTPSRAARARSFGSSQFVVPLRLAQRLLEVAARAAAGRSATHRRASARRGTPRSGRPCRRSARASGERARPTRSCMPASAPMRARTSPARFVSCVCEARSCSGWRVEPLERGRWKLVGREREAAGVAADLVQRREAELAVERGVLDALRHHRRRSSAASARRTRRAAGERRLRAGRRVADPSGSTARRSSVLVVDGPLAGSTYVR